MTKSPREDLEAFLRRQDATDLVALLLELAQEHDAVRARLARMQLADRPDKLAAGFKTTLASLRRSTRFYDYREANGFVRTLGTWLDQVAHELLPIDPSAALSLFEAFIETDEKWFERVDDSDGLIGELVQNACRYWLQAAAQIRRTARRLVRSPARAVRDRPVRCALGLATLRRAAAR